jgi:hypothetical protein
MLSLPMYKFHAFTHQRYIDENDFIQIHSIHFSRYDGIELQVPSLSMTNLLFRLQLIYHFLTSYSIRLPRMLSPSVRCSFIKRSNKNNNNIRKPLARSRLKDIHKMIKGLEQINSYLSLSLSPPQIHLITCNGWRL